LRSLVAPVDDVLASGISGRKQRVVARDLSGGFDVSKWLNHGFSRLWDVDTLRSGKSSIAVTAADAGVDFSKLTSAERDLEKKAVEICDEKKTRRRRTTARFTNDTPILGIIDSDY